VADEFGLPVYGDVIRFTFGSFEHVAMVVINSVDLTGIITSDENTTMGPDYDQGLLVLGLTEPQSGQAAYHQKGMTATRRTIDHWEVIE
jgi:hypothetical protein